MNLLQQAKRKARYGHKDWLYWRDRKMNEYIAPRNKESIKKAMLACGTCGYYFVVCANNGNLLQGDWRMGVTMINNSKYGI